ncbi:hypothetical protein NC653_039604 [Populus alba x Populus x berolinensis]|uniref:Uncharacterized protein n=1 Tax=Populus alba x Populus x berolinensis TaxID=444605 RepID=A0AAD6PQR4_9ROSI|nr:hypothetical protein NC653_039604 [Populus alba x Populus x berolinensis]
MPLTFRFLPNTSCYNCWEKLLAPPPLGNRMVHGLCFQIRSVNTAGVALLLPSMEELKTLELIRKMITERGTNFNSMILVRSVSDGFLIFQNGLEVKKTNMGCWIMKEFTPNGNFTTKIAYGML